MSTVKSYSISNINNEGRRFWDGVSAWNFSLTNPARLGYQSATIQKSGGIYRFTGVDIPAGTTITDAKIKLYAYQDDAVDTVCVYVHGQAADNAAVLVDEADFELRSWCVNKTDWSPGHWTSSTRYDSPQIKDVISEIVGRVGWVSGNSIVLTVDDFDDRTAHVNSTSRRASTLAIGEGQEAILSVTYDSPAAGGGLRTNIVKKLVLRGVIK